MAKKRAVAVCKKCGARYIPRALESGIECAYCRGETRQFSVCLHNVPLTEACAVCIALNGSPTIRALARTKAGKVVKVKKSEIRKPDEKGAKYYFDQLRAANDD